MSYRTFAERLVQHRAMYRRGAAAARRAIANNHQVPRQRALSRGLAAAYWLGAYHAVRAASARGARVVSPMAVAA